MWLIVWLLTLLVIVYQAVDVWQTYLLLEVGLTEANPIVNVLISWFGTWPGLIIMKAFFVAILITSLRILQTKGRY